MYVYIQLDPRLNVENAPFTYGVEVTEARFLNGQPNLDHHGEGATSDTPSASKQALTAQLPEDGAVLATVRPDADSITAMAVLASRADGRMINKAIVTAIDKQDRLGLQVRTRHKYAPIAIGRVAADFKRSMADRVAFVQSVLDGTVDRAEVMRLVAERDAEYASAYKASEVRLEANGRVAVVESTHRFATAIGYEAATVVVAFNPEMAVMAKNEQTGRFQPTGETYRKFTVCRFNEHVSMDWDGMVAELCEHEAGWGGRDTILGSPQNRSSEMDLDEVVEIVKKFLE